MRIVLAAALALSLATGCLSHDVRVAPVRVAEVAAALRHEGTAVVRDVDDEELRIDADERDGSRGHTLRTLVRRCPDQPASPYRPNDPGCRFAGEGQPVRLSRTDVWGSVALWGGALLVATVAGTLLGLSGALDPDE